MTYGVCGIAARMYFPPGDTTNGNYGIWWTDYQETPPGQLMTVFQVNFYATTQEGPLEIAFDKPVKNFTLTMHRCYGCGPDEGDYYRHLSPGHYMVAQDSSGQELTRIDFDAGVSVSEKTLAVGGIRKVIVYPVILGPKQPSGTPVEKVKHQAAFEVDCPPVGDPIIDSDDFKSRYDSLMRSSRPTMEHLFGREWGMRGWINPSTMKVEIDWPTFTDNDPCHVTIGASSDPRIPLTRIHSHVFVTGTWDTAVCGLIDAPYDPQANGGSLNESGDWDSSAGQGDYIFTPEWAFKLPPGTPVDQRPLNPFRWKKGANGCFAKIAVS